MPPRKVSIESSFRYGVIGLYRDRDKLAWRLYPIPFVRISFHKTIGVTVYATSQE